MVVCVDTSFDFNDDGSVAVDLGEDLGFLGQVSISNKARTSIALGTALNPNKRQLSGLPARFTSGDLFPEA